MNVHLNDLLKMGKENLRAILTNHLNEHNSIRHNKGSKENSKEKEPPISNITYAELSGCKNHNCSCHNRGGSF